MSMLHGFFPVLLLSGGVIVVCAAGCAFSIILSSRVFHFIRLSKHVLRSFLCLKNLNLLKNVLFVLLDPISDANCFSLLNMANSSYGMSVMEESIDDMTDNRPSLSW